MTDEWELPDDLTAARVARQHTAEALRGESAADESVDDAVLIASELAANAVRHGTPPVLLRIQRIGDRVRITVSNHGDSPDPRILTAEPGAPHGRGLAMVEALAVEVGWGREGDRLDVWAEVAVSPS